MVRKETRASGSTPQAFPLTETIWISLGKNKTQSLFLVILIILCPFLGLFLKEFNSIYEMRLANNPSYSWPKYSDLLLAILSSCIIIGLFHLILKLFTSPAMHLISPSYQGLERYERAERMVKSVFKGTYFTVAAVSAYILSKDSFYLPASLGGNGDVNNTYKGFPYYDQSTFTYLREYFMIQLGYHFSSLIMLFTSKMRSDFMEMLLHHSITVFLLSLAYLMNYWPISLMILYTHDVSDAFVCFCRVFVDTKYKIAALICYLGLMVTWVYTRLIIFPFDLIRVSCYDNPMYHEMYGLGILGAMAHTLVALHIYWFYLLIQMGIRFAITKTPKDIQNDLSRDRKEEN